jgi:ABC-type xylose transport system permease subunit
VRTFGIWVSGLLASALVGGFIGSIFESEYDYTHNRTFLCGIAGLLIFTCARLWLASGTKKARITDDGAGRMFGLKRKANTWRESWVAGATNTGNVTVTLGNKLVLNWHGTPTQRDEVLQMFPRLVRDKLMPGVELGSCRRHHRQHSR